MAVKVVTTGEKTSAQAQAVPLTSTGGLHVGVPMETFSLPWNGHVVTFRERMRISVDTAMKAAVVASDRAVVWES